MKDVFGGSAKKGALPQGNKLERVMQQLKELARRQAMKPGAQEGSSAEGKAAAGSETVADDGRFSAEKQQMIAASEAVIRPVLKMFGVDYDALIRMDGKSPYAMAVAAKPDVLQGVMGAENPVLAALQVATGYQPYAEFETKYGREPGEIKEKIRAEVLAEDEAQGTGPGARGGREQQSLVFSQRYAPGRAAAPMKKTGLNEVFGK